MRRMLNYYDTHTISNAAVKDCLSILMETLRAAVQAHDNGDFIDQKYIQDHYLTEVDAFRQSYNALTDSQKSEARRVVFLLAESYRLRRVMTYFGVSEDMI